MNEPIRPVYWILLGLCLVFQVTAVILGKTAALRMGTPTLVAFLTNRWYLAGLGCLLLQAVCWQLVLRRIRLVVAYPITSLSYLLILGASRVFFLERINSFNITGSFVIVIGAWMVIHESWA